MWISLPTLALILGTVSSGVGIYFAFRAYLLKAGMLIRGSYTVTSSIACEDQYVSRITLENRKDRAVTIFTVYLQIGPNLFVIVEDFGDAPLVLKAFETYQQLFDPIEFYSINLKRVSFNALLKDEKIKRRLVLSTSNGKYVVKNYLRRWDPVHLFFRNHMTGIAHSMRSTFKGKAYGSNAAFIVELQLRDGSEQVVPIYPRDYELKRFRQLNVTKESLESKEALEALLNLERRKGNHAGKSVKVHDPKTMHDDPFDLYKAKTIEAKRVGAIQYHLLGPLLTRLSNWQMRRENKKRSRQSQLKDS